MLLEAAAFLALAPSAWAAAPVAAVSTATARAEVAVSSAATVASLYPVDRLRDPFTRVGAGKTATRPFSLEDFSIHKLSLRGIMTDELSEFALFVDSEAGASFLLRKGRLYDPKRKPIPGIGGHIATKTKTVTLTAPGGDAQAFRLGEAEKE